jgi:hypothetical protein
MPRKKPKFDSQTATKPQPGDPFLCPNCGEQAWVAYYPETSQQDVSLIVGEDGEPEIEDWLGCTETVCDGDYDVDSYRCSVCDHTITIGNFTFLTPAELGRRMRIDEILTGLKQAQTSELGMNSDVAWNAVSELAGLAPKETP